MDVDAVEGAEKPVTLKTPEEFVADEEMTVKDVNELVAMPVAGVPTVSVSALPALPALDVHRGPADVVLAEAEVERVCAAVAQIADQVAAGREPARQEVARMQARAAEVLARAESAGAAAAAAAAPDAPRKDASSGKGRVHRLRLT